MAALADIALFSPKADGTPESSQPFSERQRSILGMLTALANARSVEVDRSQLKVHLRGLEHFSDDDIRSGLAWLCFNRSEGEPLWPPLPTVVEIVKQHKGRRVERLAQEARDRDSAYFQTHRGQFVSMKEVSDEVADRRRRRAAGENVPIERRQWSSADTARYLERQRQRDAA